MNTTKHTPGPWKCVDPHVIRGPKNVVVAKTLDSKEGYEIKQANAHLIAAAPAMYEALQQAQELLRSLVAEEMIHTTELQRVGNCQATMWQTLAQAEGR